MNGFQVYLHIRPSSEGPVVFYVGKGSDARSRSWNGRSSFWKAVVRKHGYEILVVDEGLTEQEAFDLERRYIAHLGRRNDPKRPDGTLVNLTDGGEGASGCKHSDAAKAKISASLTGKVLSPATRAKIAAKTAQRKGWHHTPATKSKLSGTHTGRVMNAEWRTKLSEASKNRAHKGVPRSPECRAKQSATKRRLFAERKAQQSQ